MTDLRQALGTLAVERPDGLWLLPSTDRELIDALHILRDEGAQLGREVRLSRERFSQLGRVEPRSMTVEAGAGVTLAALEEYLRPHDLGLGPLTPAASRLSLAEFLEGPYAGLRSIPGGRLEPLVAQLEGVLADGRRVTTQPGPRSATGPDLSALFLGAGGRVGLVTQALVRAFTVAQATVELSFSFPSAASVVDSLTLAITHGCWLGGVRVEARGGRWIAEARWSGSVGAVERDREALKRAVEHYGGRQAGELGFPPAGGTERETTWDAVRAALEKGAILELYRLSLGSVIAKGDVQGLPLDAPAPWPSALVARALDPRQTLGGAP